MNQPITEPVETSYAGWPALALPTSKPGVALTMGINKYRVILQHLAAVQAFVEKHKDFEHPDLARASAYRRPHHTAPANPGVTPERISGSLPGMTKTGRVEVGKTPSTVSGKPSEKIEQGEAIRRGEEKKLQDPDLERMKQAAAQVDE